MRRLWTLGMRVAPMMWIACGGASLPPAKAPVSTPVEKVPQTPVPVAAVKPTHDRQVAVMGLEGTLSAFDVQVTMEGQMDALARCQGDSLPRVPHLAGELRVGIHVLPDGVVSEVLVVESSVGDRETEICIRDVVRGTRFPEPHGGEADVTWSITLDGQGRSPATWNVKRIAKQRRERARPVRKSCELRGGGRRSRVRVTAYVRPSGRVMAAGAAAKENASDEQLDCVTADVKTWRLPRGKRVAKVSFDL